MSTQKKAMLSQIVEGCQYESDVGSAQSKCTGIKKYLEGMFLVVGWLISERGVVWGWSAIETVCYMWNFERRLIKKDIEIDTELRCRS